MGEKGQKTREMILEKAYLLFAQKGFKLVTMTDICVKTGLSRGGLYRHYSGTGEILTEILSKEYVIDNRIERGESAISILEQMLSFIEDEIMEKERSLSLAIYEYASTGQEALFHTINERAKKRWISLLDYGIQTGEFKEINVNQIVELILYYYQGLRMWSRVVSFDTSTATNYSDCIRSLLIK